VENGTRGSREGKNATGEQMVCKMEDGGNIYDRMVEK
jgi:hypothetical protein